MYSFLFDRRSMALLLTCMAAAGLLLFAGGVFVGLQLQLDGSAPVTVAQFRPMGPAEPAPSTRPAATPPAVEPPPAASPEPQAAPAAAATPEPPAGRPEPAAEPPALLAAAPPPDGAPLPEQQIVLGAADETVEARPAALERPEALPRAVPAALPAPGEARQEPAGPPADWPVDESVPVLTHGDLADSDGEPTFAVQVAAFELRSTASQIAAEFTRRGWDAYLVPFETASGREMYSIRFGRYDTSAEAYRAAREFEKIEKAQTLVRLQLRDD